MTSKKTFEYRIYPNRNQQVKLINTLNLCRKLYNACLFQRKIAYQSHGITITRYDQNKQLIEVKNTFPEYKSVHSQVLQSVPDRLNKSFNNFFRRIKTGEKPGYPRFKSRWRYNSFTYTQGGFKLLFDVHNPSMKYNRLRLSKIGDIKISFHRPLPKNSKIKQITIKRDKCDDWYACLHIEIENNPNKVKFESINKGNCIGVDVGITDIVAFSSGELISNPKFLKNIEYRTKKKQRRMSKKKKGSGKRNKARIKWARSKRKLHRQREDYHHKLSRMLVNRYQLIAFEDLNIKSMVVDNELAKQIHDSAWGSLIRKTIYKAVEAGKYVVLVNPSYTSQECSQCGGYLSIELSDRHINCSRCNNSMNRDINAANNILNRAYHELGLDKADVKPTDITATALNMLNKSMKDVSRMNELGSPGF